MAKYKERGFKPGDRVVLTDVFGLSGYMKGMQGIVGDPAYDEDSSDAYLMVLLENDHLYRAFKDWRFEHAVATMDDTRDYLEATNDYGP